jgi:hypothetical protein
MALWQQRCKEVVSARGSLLRIAMAPAFYGSADGTPLVGCTPGSAMPDSQALIATGPVAVPSQG